MAKRQTRRARRPSTPEFKAEAVRLMLTRFRGHPE